MELERDVRIIIIAHLDDENCLEPIDKKRNEQKIRFNEKFKTIPELFSGENEDDETSFINGFQMKCRFIKSSQMLSLTHEHDRLIEIVEPTRHQPHIDVYKHYPIRSFDLTILSTRLDSNSTSINDWWLMFKMLTSTTNNTKITDDEKQIRLLCAPAFNLPLPKQLAKQSACLIRFYEMFKSTVFLLYPTSFSSSLLSTIMHIIPAIQLDFRPTILHWFDERASKHPRLKNLLNNNDLCLVAGGSKVISFKYDFSLIERHIIGQFNASEWQLNTLVKLLAMKHLRCSLDNSFLRTSILWICELHQLDQYHDIFEVWISFMRDVCRRRFLSHYFLENVNIFEEHPGLKELLDTIHYRNIDTFVEQLKENLIFPYVYQYDDRLKNLITFFESQPVLEVKMKMIYNVIVKSHFPHADASLNEMCSILCHLSFMEDDDSHEENVDDESRMSFWRQQWKPLFVDFDRPDIVLLESSFEIRPDQLAQQMTSSVLKLIQMDLVQMINRTRTNPRS